MFDETPELPEEQVTELTRYTVQLLRTREKISDLEKQLEETKAYEQELSRDTIPKKMFSLNMQEFTLKDGFKIKIKHKFVGSIPKDEDKRIAAFDWLVNHNLEDIIKNEIRCDFKKGEGELAQKVIEALESLNVGWSRKKDVHHQTLKACVKDLLAKGEEVPLDKLGLIEIDETEIKI